jgi:hypothetical protein
VAPHLARRFAIHVAARGIVIEALTIAAYDSAPTAASGVKVPIMNLLETSAITVERELPRAFPSGDAATDAWICEHARAAAAGLRDLKRPVFALGPDGDAILAWQVARTLERVVRADYAGLERGQPPRIHSSRSRRALTLLVTVATADAPIVIVLVAKSTTDWIDGALSGTLVTLSLAWAAVTLLARYDPLFTVKLAALKDTSALFKPPAS